MKMRVAVLVTGLFCLPALVARAAPVAPKVSESATPTFTKDIAPLVFQNCTACHRPGEVAPFSLTTYAEVKKRAKQIVDVTDSRLMPPWKAEPGHGDFLGERRLTDAQIRTVREWADHGTPEGDPAALPPVPKFTDGWQLGEPDLVVKVPEAYTLPAEGADVFRCFVVPLNLPEDKYVTAVEFRPSNRKIVHHALFFLDNTGAARQLDAADPGPGYTRMGGVGFTPSGGLGGWAPGVTARFLPNDVARNLRKGSDLVIQTHFHPSGKVETEQSTVGIYFAKTPPKAIAESFPKAFRRFNIPAGDKHYVIDDTFTVPADVTLIGITPHAHLLCQEIKVDATYPDGTKKPLVWVKNWDWGWQDQYLYKEPIRIPRGTKVDLRYVYDNSADNPKNPTLPPRPVRWGEQTADEMAITFFQIVVDRNADGLLRTFLNLARRGATTAPSDAAPKPEGR